MDPHAPAMPSPAAEVAAAERAVYAAEVQLDRLRRRLEPKTKELADMERFGYSPDKAPPLRAEIVKASLAIDQAAADLEAKRTALCAATGRTRLTRVTDLPAELIQPIVAAAFEFLQDRVRAAAVCHSWAHAILRAPGPVWERVDTYVANLAACSGNHPPRSTTSLDVGGRVSSMRVLQQAIESLAAPTGLRELAVSDVDVDQVAPFAGCVAHLFHIVASSTALTGLTNLTLPVKRMSEAELRASRGDIEAVAPRLRALFFPPFTPIVDGFPFPLFSNVTSLGQVFTSDIPDAARLPRLERLDLQVGRLSLLTFGNLGVGAFPALRELSMKMFDNQLLEDPNLQGHQEGGGAAAARASMAAVARTLKSLHIQSHEHVPSLTSLPRWLSVLTGLQQLEFEQLESMEDGSDFLNMLDVSSIAALPALTSLSLKSVRTEKVTSNRPFPALRRLVVDGSWPIDREREAASAGRRNIAITLPRLPPTLHALYINQFKGYDEPAICPYDLAHLVREPTPARIIKITNAVLFVGGHHKSPSTNTLSEFTRLARQNLLHRNAPPLSLHLHGCRVADGAEGDIAAAAVDWLRAQLRVRGRLCEAEGPTRWRACQCMFD